MKTIVTLLVLLVVVGRFITGVNGEGGWYRGGIGDGMPIHWDRIYIDFAHAIVFGLFGAAWMGRHYRYNAFDAGLAAKTLFWTAVAITVLEVVVAVGARKFAPFGNLLDAWNLFGSMLNG